jgi:hypothetical protein
MFAEVWVEIGAQQGSLGDADDRRDWRSVAVTVRLEVGHPCRPRSVSADCFGELFAQASAPLAGTCALGRTAQKQALLRWHDSVDVVHRHVQPALSEQTSLDDEHVGPVETSAETNLGNAADTTGG